MDYKLLFWVGAAIVLGIVIKIISSRADAKPDEWTNAKSRTSTRTKPTSRRFDDGATKSAPRFDANQKKTTAKRPATSFSSEIGSGGRFPVSSLLGYKITLYIVHFIIYFFSSLFLGGIFFFVGYLLYRLTMYYNNNVKLDHLSPAQQLDFIDYVKSITGSRYFLMVAVPVFILSSALRVAIVFLTVTFFLNSNLLHIMQQSL